MTSIKETYCLLMILGFLFFFASSVFSQDQKLADSLYYVYAEESVTGVGELELLSSLAFNEVNNLTLGLKYAEELLLLAERENNHYYLFQGYLHKASKKWTLGDLDEALDALLLGMEAAKKSGSVSGEGAIYCAMADIYKISNNHANAMLYYHKAIDILRQSTDSIALASTIVNAGDAYLTHQDYDSALYYFTESGKIFEQLNHLIGKAYNLGNIGMVHANIGENVLAEQNINEAILILEESGDYYPVCFYLISMSDIYLDKGDFASALSYASRSLKLAEQYKLKQQISDANLKLSELYEKAGRPEESLTHYKSHIVYRDSVNNVETVQKIADQRTEFEVNLREKEIGLLEKSQALDRTYIVVAIMLLTLAVVVLLYFRQRFMTTRLLSISERKEHSEKIKDLLNRQETKALMALVKGRDDERKRLAEELHNHLGSLLATIKVNVNGIDEEAIPNHGTISTLVDQACSDVRNISHTLNMGISEDFGLVPALKELTAHVSKSSGLEVEFYASISKENLSGESEIMTYRIIQELVSNALKHAEASKLSVLLTCFVDQKLISIIVQDNGKGFEVEKVHHKKSQGMGLESLRKMVTDLNGEICFDSNPESGTTVTIDLPITIEANLI